MTLEDGGNTEVALEDGSGATALGSSIGWWLKIALAALGSSGCRQTCYDGVGVSIVEAKGLLYSIGNSVGKDGERGRAQCKGCTPAAMARR